nr:retrovirus-related Pol polyprotein from transposon TNT 1-94 [Tanacetum cinerariifolium]
MTWGVGLGLYLLNGVNILKSIDEGPYQIGTVREILAESTEGAPQFGPERPRVYSDLSPEEKDQYNADIRATNILLQGLPKDIYTLINHYTDAKDIWDNVNMLLEGFELTKEDRESQLYDDFEHFRQHKGESIHDYYVWFSKLINDMRNIKMTMSRMQLNSKFVNNMLPEWGRFVPAVKLNRGLRDSNYDQLYAYLKQHETHAKENKMMLERFSLNTVDPLALMSNVSNPQLYSPSSSTSSSTQVPQPLADTLTLTRCSWIWGSSEQSWECQSGSSKTGKVLQLQQYKAHRKELYSTKATTELQILQRQDVADAGSRERSSFGHRAAVVSCRLMTVTRLILMWMRPQLHKLCSWPICHLQILTDEARPSYDSDILYEVHDHDHYQDAVCAHHEDHVMHESVQLDHVFDSHADYTSDSNMIPYDQYVKDNEVPVIHSDVSSVPNDAFMIIYNDMCEPHAQSVSNPSRNTVVKNSLTAELATYKEQVELYERRAKFELTEREQKINEQLRLIISDRNFKKETLKKELHSIKLQLASTINHNKSMVEEVTFLKKDFKQKEKKYLEDFLDMKSLKEKDTLEMAEITRKKMNAKMNDPECVTRKVKIAPHDYSKENFLATFTPQKQLTPEQIFWSNDLIKLKSKALKEQTRISRPIKVLTVPESSKVHQQFKATTTKTTTTTITLPPPPAQQQSTAEAMMMKRISELEHIMANLIQENKGLEERLDSHGACLYILEQLDILHHVRKAITLEKSMNHDHSQELAQDLAEARKKKKKIRESPKTPPGSPPHQPPPPPPPAGPSGASGSSQVPPPPPPPSFTNQESQSKGSDAPSSSKTAASYEYQAWTTTDIRLRPSISLTPADLEMDEDMAPDEQAQSSDDEDIGSAHIPKVNLRQDWWKPLEKERPATPEPAWSIPSSDVPVPTNNWASALVSNYSPPPEDSLLAQTGDIATFMDWFYKRRGITELKPQDLEGPAFEIVKVFHPDVIHLQYQMEECHKLLTDSMDEPILRHNVSKPLPLGGPLGQVTIQSDFFFNKDLEYLRYGSKGSRPALSVSKMKAAYYPDARLEQMVPNQFWIEEECKYDIAAMYRISHWWFQRQCFYIDRHTSEGDRNAIRTHIQILSVVRIEVFSMYGYDYMKKIVLRRADLNEHVIVERDFKYLYPSEFEDLYLLNLQGHLNHLSPKDKKILTTAKRLKTRRIFRNLESFVGGRVRDGDYRLLKRTR